MDYNTVLIELNRLIDKLDNIIDIMLESTKEVIDLGNVNYELKNIISKLDMIIESMKDSNEKNKLESSKDNIIYASLDVIDNADVFNKINRLKEAKIILIDTKTKIYSNGSL